MILLTQVEPYAKVNEEPSYHNNKEEEYEKLYTPLVVDIGNILEMYL